MQTIPTTLPVNQPIYQSTWSNSPEALLENKLIYELKFHYDHGSKDKKNEIENALIHHIMNTCCTLPGQSDDAISFSAELVQQYFFEEINNKNKELAESIKNTHQVDLSLFSQEPYYSTKKNDDIKILRDFITKISPENNIEIALAKETTKTPNEHITHILTSKNIEIADKATINNEVKIEQPVPDHKKENLISNILSNIAASLYGLFSPHR